ncbi:uroporphyrinogen decarboxylase family protein [Clostridium ihumii]|uniref:uroporphyrinogen decarboxylase family protein n=1 Tax=Clostridium ihumii TaxID=1470356 RepID=UPI0006878CBD|nr:uroporphyrinogen decarboxylase family protein [Clostridium ihumii]
MNEKERLLKVLRNEEVDRPPVICPGGMMNAAVTDILLNIDKNHNCDCDSMVKAAKLVNEEIGFENYGVPFCMTVEAEPLGIELSFGDKTVEPRVTKYNENELEEIIKSYNIKPLMDKRMPVVIEAIKKLKNDNVPVIGNITGPISTATSIVDPLKLIKMFRREPELAYKFIEYVNEYSIDYAKEMIKAGADVIAISDPTATGEILGKKNFEKFAYPMYRKFLDEMHKVNTPVIIHICGDSKNIIESLDDLNIDAVSFDSRVNMRDARLKIKNNLMGNVSTQLLHQGDKERIIRVTENCIASGVNIVSPACGLSMATPKENLKIMTSYVKGRSN